MASAYGNRPPNRRKPPPRRADMPGWVWALVGLTVGLAVAAYVYITRPVDPMPVVATPRQRARTRHLAHAVAAPVLVL